VVDIQTGRRFRALAQKQEGYTEEHLSKTLDTGELQPLFLSVVLWGDAMREKFGRELQAGSPTAGYSMEFQVESYLRHQGSKFARQFDANTYLLMTKALDHFDPAKDYGNNLARAFRDAAARFLVLAFTGDWRFSAERSREIVRALLENDKDVVYAEIEAHEGHDAFLMNIPRYLEVFHTYMKRVAAEVAG